jgi:hypothetical protein
MRSREVAAVKVEIVLLPAMIGQRLAGDLSSGNASTVGKPGKKERIHAGALLKHIQDSLGAFINKRNCSDLDAGHFVGGSTMPRSWHGQGGTGSSGDLQEFAVVHVRFQHAPPPGMDYSYFLW